MDSHQPKHLAFEDYPKEPVDLANVSIEFMRQACFIPLWLKDNALVVALARPNDHETVEALRFAYNLQVETRVGRADDILDAIERLYGAGRQSMETIIEEAGKGMDNGLADGEADADHLRDMASEAPIIRLVNRLILDAVELGASDIHFEPYEREFKVRYRIDGVLNEVEAPPKRFQAAVISRVKIMAKLNISERRLPQDGRVKLKIRDSEIDFRVSTVPTLFGESLVMRILNRETLLLDLKKLGFPETILHNYLRLITQPYGMILVTGPTGSGKTSTLYATLALLNSPENKVITLEDPVEYQLHGVNQIQVNPKIGLTFANGLRSIVRQDPDIILVGEIRDRETAETAIQSALTGHLLFSTLHTNNAVGAVTRLLDMGIEDFLLSSTLLGILAQRLVRLICPHCKKAVPADEKMIASMGVEPGDVAGVTFYEGSGCESCRQTGYKGRSGIFEYLRIDDDIRKSIMAQAGADSIGAVARQKGFTSLREDGWRKVLQGETSIAEVLRVTMEV